MDIASNQFPLFSFKKLVLKYLKTGLNLNIFIGNLILNRVILIYNYDWLVF